MLGAMAGGEKELERMQDVPTGDLYNGEVERYVGGRVV